MAKTKTSKKKAASQSSKQKTSGKQQGGQKQNKKKSWPKGNWDSGDHLSTELKAVGLRVKEVVGDGNCCFRAIGDQLEGDKADHRSIRKEVCQYIEDNEDMFAPFIEDDESFENYLKRMRKDSTWAGQIELQAASLAFEVNICIYQYQQPRWTLSNFADNGSNTIHISYHDGEHYNSVRKIDDYETGPPEKVEMKAANGVSNSTDWNNPSEEDIQKEEIVGRNTGCQDQNMIRQALTKCSGNVDEAVELVIDQMAGIQDMDTDAQQSNPIPADQNNSNSNQTQQSTQKNNIQEQDDQNQNQGNIDGECQSTAAVSVSVSAMEIDELEKQPQQSQQQQQDNTLQQQQLQQQSCCEDGNSNDLQSQQENQMDIDQKENQEQEDSQINVEILQNGIKLVEDYEDSDEENSPLQNAQNSQSQQQEDSEIQQQNNQQSDQQVENKDENFQNGQNVEENNQQQQQQQQQQQKIVEAGDLQNGNLSEDDGKSKKKKKMQKEQENLKKPKNDLSNQKKFPRNKPCHCGSGRKYKNCHGPIDLARKRRGEEGQLTEKDQISQKIETNSVYLQDVVSL